MYSAAEKYFVDMAFVGKNLDQYYSVEIPVPELNIIYQFKIWETDSNSMSILIREDSDLLNWIETGDKIKMKYYSHDPIHRYQVLDTDLLDIQRQRNGRLKGHCLAGLEITEHQDEKEIFLPYWPDNSHITPFQLLQAIA
jgi:hypothetical protein